jgi:hypothetical protein
MPLLLRAWLLASHEFALSDGLVWLDVQCACGRSAAIPLRMMAANREMASRSLADVLIQLRCRNAAIAAPPWPIGSPAGTRDPDRRGPVILVQIVTRKQHAA